MVEVTEEIEEGEEKRLWSTGDFKLKMTKKNLQRLSLKLQGKKEDAEGVIENVKHFDAAAAAAKVTTRIQNMIRTTDVCEGVKWEEFRDACFKKVKSFEYP